MHQPLHTETRSTRAAKGEPMVWLTGMGLGVGLVMIGYLLWLIVSQGLAVFWPDPVTVVTLKDGSAAGIAGARTMSGEIVRVQERKAVVIEEGAPPVSREEWQFFTGNKDVYGFSFKYIDRKEIEAVSHPEDVMVIERIEWGDAIGTPLALQLEDGRTISAAAVDFEEHLVDAVKEADRRRARIRRIERKSIGAINRQMRELDLQERTLAMEGKPDGSALESIARQRAELQARYETLAAQATEAREQQEAGALLIRLGTGGEHRVNTGDIVQYYYPNRLDIAGKVKLFSHNLVNFVKEEPREANTEGGIFPAIFGTFVMTLLMSIAVVPFGVMAAIYLREYAMQGPFVRSVRIAVNNLAGVPSIVFGVFGLGFFVYLAGGTIDQLFYKASLPTPTFGTGGILWASLTLALMTVPVVIVATEEALAAVPRGAREGSLACGASKWQTIQRVVLPASSGGILTGLILAMARGAGEVAPLMLVGVVKLAPSLPLDANAPFLHLDRKFMHLGFHIYDLGFQSPDSEAARPMVFATTLFLILLVVLLNLTAIIIRERLRRKYATGAF